MESTSLLILLLIEYGIPKSTSSFEPSPFDCLDSDWSHSVDIARVLQSLLALGARLVSRRGRVCTVN